MIIYPAFVSGNIYSGGTGETREPELGKSYKENKADNVMFVTAGGTYDCV